MTLSSLLQSLWEIMFEENPLPENPNIPLTGKAKELYKAYAQANGEKIRLSVEKAQSNNP